VNSDLPTIAGPKVNPVANIQVDALEPLSTLINESISALFDD
jgi:hypothetical protein